MSAQYNKQNIRCPRREKVELFMLSSIWDTIYSPVIHYKIGKLHVRNIVTYL